MWVSRQRECSRVNLKSNTLWVCGCLRRDGSLPVWSCFEVSVVLIQCDFRFLFLLLCRPTGSWWGSVYRIKKIFFPSFFLACLLPNNERRYSPEQLTTSSPLSRRLFSSWGAFERLSLRPGAPCWAIKMWHTWAELEGTGGQKGQTANNTHSRKQDWGVSI